MAANKNTPVEQTDIETVLSAVDSFESGPVRLSDLADMTQLDAKIIETVLGVVERRHPYELQRLWTTDGELAWRLNV